MKRICEYKSYLNTLIKKSEEEGILKPGSRFLITEAFKRYDGSIQYCTIWCMETYVDREDLLEKYGQYIEERLQWY